MRVNTRLLLMLCSCIGLKAWPDNDWLVNFDLILECPYEMIWCYHIAYFSGHSRKIWSDPPPICTGKNISEVSVQVSFGPEKTSDETIHLSVRHTCKTTEHVKYFQKKLFFFKEGAEWPRFQTVRSHFNIRDLGDECDLIVDCPRDFQDRWFNSHERYIFIYLFDGEKRIKPVQPELNGL